MTTSSTYRTLVQQLDAHAFPDVPQELTQARQALRAAEQATQQLNTFGPPRLAAIPGGFINTRQTASGPTSYAEALARRLGEGEALPVDLVEQAYAAAVFDAKAAAADVVCRSLSVHVVTAFDQVADESAAALLAGLGRQLEEIVTAAKAAGAVLADYDVTDPAELVGAPADVRTAYGELGRLAEEYDRLRAAQRATERADEVAGYDLYVRLGLVDVEDALALWPGWREAERDRHARLPWPEDKRAKLLLVASRRPWVATLARMQSVRTAALSAAVAA